ncbi:MAG: divalent-cation tolerance protein CutA [Burkholderiaceae bacterium]|nr:MAG: divalent-cation tolerance protein CutA [Burkholderiaceae bacterium]
MSKNKYLAVFTSVAKRVEAQNLARSILDQRFAACVQISEIESLYHWNGNIQNDTEYRVMFKTDVNHYAQLEQAIREVHPYELPAIYALPMEAIDPAFAAWVDENLEEL